MPGTWYVNRRCLVQPQGTRIIHAAVVDGSRKFASDEEKQKLQGRRFHSLLTLLQYRTDCSATQLVCYACRSNQRWLQQEASQKSLREESERRQEEVAGYLPHSWWLEAISIPIVDSVVVVHDVYIYI